MDKYDVALLGAGLSGTYAALKIAKEHKNIKTILFDAGRPPQKRRVQCLGFLGLLPNSDGKFFLNDLNSLTEIAGTKKSNAAYKWFNNYTKNIIDLKVIKDRSPNINMEKKIKKAGFDFQLNNHIQIYPRDIHLLSKNIANILYAAKHITMSFDNEILDIIKQKKSFIITSQNGQVEAKRILVACGRAGWRWVKQLYDQFDIVENNDIAKFGIRVDISSAAMKDFNKSCCSIFKQGIEISPLSYGGSIIPEDHVDFANASFRSNEARWNSDRVSFDLIGERKFEGKGAEEADRIAQLTFVLCNDRILREKISTILNNKSTISVMKEYNWLTEAINDISTFLPEIITKGYFNIPCVVPIVPSIEIGNDFSTNANGIYCAGESAGVKGMLFAALSGIVVGDSICK